jgi:hypothetical protein
LNRCAQRTDFESILLRRLVVLHVTLVVAEQRSAIACVLSYDFEKVLKNGRGS